MKKWLALILLSHLLVAGMTGFLVAAVYLLMPLSFSIDFSDRPAIVTHAGERYHVLPESQLDKAVLIIMDRNDKKYYVISEQKIRLLGTKLLTGGE